MRLVLALTTLVAALSAQAADPSPFLWRIGQGDARHHLVGSIHLLPDAAALPPELEEAYAGSAGLVFESDLTALASPALQATLLKAAAQPGGVKKELPAPSYERLQRRAATLGMPMTVCDTFKAWFCALSLEVFSFQASGFRSEFGLDQQLHGRALKDDKSITWLEPPDEHLALFHQMSPELGRQFLESTLNELESGENGPQELLRIWRTGDLAAMDRLTAEFKTQHPAAYERLLAMRNRLWVQRLPAKLKGEPQLVVVGAAHLAGPDALPLLLQRAGWKVEPVARTARPVPQSGGRITVRIGTGVETGVGSSLTARIGSVFGSGS